MKKRLIIMVAMFLIGSRAYSATLGERNVQKPITENTEFYIQQDTAKHEVNAQIFFRIGKSDIDLDFKENRVLLNKFITTLKNVLSDSKYLVNRVLVVGTSSPDGSEELNNRLAEARAKSLAKYLQHHVSLPDHKIVVINGGVNWSGLKLAMEASTNMPHQKEMLKLMDIADSKTRKHKMMYYADSKPWVWMSNNLFDSVRTFTTKFDYKLIQKATVSAAVEPKEVIAESPKNEAPVKQAEIAEVLPLPLSPAIQPNIVASPKKFVPLLAFKTDLMLWAGVMPNFKLGTWTPNLAAEFYFARRWSAQGGYSYANWNSMYGSKELFALSVGDIELRHWFGKRSKFRGFFLGAFGQYGQYDIQSGVQGNTGSFWSAGLGAGWAQNLSRNWILELEVRGGYRSANNSLYDIKIDADKNAHYYFNSSSTESNFFPSLKLNIIYRIGKPNKR